MHGVTIIYVTSVKKTYEYNLQYTNKVIVDDVQKVWILVLPNQKKKKASMSNLCIFFAALTPYTQFTAETFNVALFLSNTYL